MITTEEEAAQRWCPYAKAATEHGADAGNRYTNRQGLTDYPGACQCIASACMAWRWQDAAEQKGFCGAFGRPIEME